MIGNEAAGTYYALASNDTIQPHAFFLNTDTNAITEPDSTPFLTSPKNVGDAADVPFHALNDFTPFPASAINAGAVTTLDPSRVWYVGYKQSSTDPQKTPGTAFLFNTAGGGIDLAALLPSEYVTSQANAINAQGVIGGAACSGTGLFGPCSPVVWRISPIVLGDVNGDTKKNVLDVILQLQDSVGIITLTASEKTAADMNKDGVVNVVDGVLNLRQIIE